jgi:hypothetical protein
MTTHKKKCTVQLCAWSGLELKATEEGAKGAANQVTPEDVAKVVNLLITKGKIIQADEDIYEVPRTFLSSNRIGDGEALKKYVLAEKVTWFNPQEIFDANKDENEDDDAETQRLMELAYKLADMNIKTTPAIETVGDKSTLTAWFRPSSVIDKTDQALQGKLVSELAAMNILDDAAFSATSISDALYRVINYAQRTAATVGRGAGDDATISALSETLRQRAGDLFGLETIQLSARARDVVRKGLVGKRFTPMSTILDTQAAAGDGAPGNTGEGVDKGTARFEIDTAMSKTDPATLYEMLQNVVIGVSAAIFSSDSLPAQITIRTNSEDGRGGFTYKDEVSSTVSPGAVLYTGRIENFVDYRSIRDTEALKERERAAKVVQRIFTDGSIPMNADNKGMIDDMLKSFDWETLCESPMILSRVERAREIELEYPIISVDYGTSDSSEYFGVGTNVTLMTDCAFIAARIIIGLFGEFTRDETAGNGKYTLSNAQEKVKGKLKEEFETGFTGFCTVRSADLGRIIGATVLNKSLANRIRAIANENGFKSRKQYDDSRLLLALDKIETALIGTGNIRNEIEELYQEYAAEGTASYEILEARTELQTLFEETNGLIEKYKEIREQTKFKDTSDSATKDADDDRLSKFYHAIWAKELGPHAVAQGNAQLEDSHMMMPFLVRATSDSEHTVPTLMAVDDWIGPTEEYYRVEQLALMAIEDFATSRPSTFYTGGGRARSFGDIGSAIKTGQLNRGNPFTMKDILEAVDDDAANRAVTVCAMLMIGVQENGAYIADTRKGGLARIKTSETQIRQLAERVARLPVGS